MTVARADDGTALLAAIAAHPDEDTPRLMLADELEATGDGARAELIRVQCELARRGPPRKKLNGECVTVRRGEIHFNVYGAASVRAEPGERVDVLNATGTRRQRKIFPGVLITKGGNRTAFFTGMLDEHSVEDPADELRARESALLLAHEARWRAAGPCPRCDGRKVLSLVGYNPCPAGTGDRGGLTARRTRRDDEPQRSELPYREEYRHRVDYVRGMKRVLCELRDVCVLPAGNLRPISLTPTPWALAVCRHHPDLLELWITDLEPSEECGFWAWHRDDRAPPGERTIYQYIEGFVREEFGPDCRSAAKLFATEEAARVQLARAAARFVRAHGPEIRT